MIHQLAHYWQRTKAIDLLHPLRIVSGGLLLSLIIVMGGFAPSIVGGKAHNEECHTIVPYCQYLEEQEGYNLADALKHAKIMPLHTVTYHIEYIGSLATDKTEFEREVQETLDHPAGWSQLAIEFKKVDKNGQITLTLISPVELAKISGCDAYWSCRSGEKVLVNEERWQKTTEPWLQDGGSIRDYRHMTVNHEVGHWLGHDHPHCGGKGKLAPVMQQQSIDLQGCRFNPWPLPSELWTNRF